MRLQSNVRLRKSRKRTAQSQKHALYEQKSPVIKAETWFANCNAHNEQAIHIMQRIEDVITGELTLNYFANRSAEGWRVARIEWVRESGALAAPESKGILPGLQPVPYGLQVAEDSTHLEENSPETTALLLILEQIVKEKRITEIAHHLNREGYLTREGAPWRPTDVFNLMPRLIEAGPLLLKSAAWTQRR